MEPNSSQGAPRPLHALPLLAVGVFSFRRLLPAADSRKQMVLRPESGACGNSPGVSNPPERLLGRGERGRPSAARTRRPFKRAEPPRPLAEAAARPARPAPGTPALQRTRTAAQAGPSRLRGEPRSCTGESRPVSGHTRGPLRLLPSSTYVQPPTSQTLRSTPLCPRRPSRPQPSSRSPGHRSPDPRFPPQPSGPTRPPDL